MILHHRIPVESLRLPEIQARRWTVPDSVLRRFKCNRLFAYPLCFLAGKLGWLCTLYVNDGMDL
jgi:hypothetical protein